MRRRSRLVGSLVLVAGLVGCAVTGAPAPAGTTAAGAPLRSSTAGHPWHTNIVSTTFWVGEVLDPHTSDGSQVVSAYDDKWLVHYGGCDGVVVGGACQTEARHAADGWFPTSMTPRENPFYLDLPFDDVNDAAAARMRAAVVPWATSPRYRAYPPSRSLMKNRWVELRRGARTCFGQVQDAGPARYDDAAYVFGADDRRPANQRYNGAGLDVSPALNGCLAFTELNGANDRVDWRFAEDADVPAGPWTRVVTTR